MTQYAKEIQKFLDTELTPEINRLTAKLATMSQLSYNSVAINTVETRLLNLVSISDFFIEYVSGSEECDWALLYELMQYTGLPIPFTGPVTADTSIQLPTPTTLGGIYANRESATEQYKYGLRLKEDGFLELDPESAGKLERDITVEGVTVGNLEDGTVLSADTPITDLLESMLQKRIPPTYAAPAASITIDKAGTYEVGTALSVTIDPTFLQRDGGALNTIEFRRNNATIHTQTTDISYIDSVTIQREQLRYNAETCYDEGPIKNDNFGDPSPAGRIPAGCANTNSITISGNYYTFYGPGAPTTSTGIRSLQKSWLTTTVSGYRLHTGNTELTMTFCVEAGYEIDYVIDETTGFDITGSYMLQGQVNIDVNGTMTPYNRYTSSTASVYDPEHIHKIVIKTI